MNPKNMDIKKIFNNNMKETLMFTNSEIKKTGIFNNKLLTFGEIISLEDEATYIDLYKEKWQYNNRDNIWHSYTDEYYTKRVN